ncbi:LacI family DNA-binding transcriptional regulator [Bradyrhizobium sp. cir1]|uniref:LacI family DNA-binding transcriptional regulator n=1 Tax=Bradyrhizobium sp. cir1 TaxID=1445730 RepID=UPI00289C9F01|nr:LacI family DNA-binding transcriptional regulator [Bradyrhizobium sp. cir1]
MTVKDVAREAGVAVGTVSRVLNDHPAVTRELRERVEKAMAHLGYEVDVTARTAHRRSRPAPGRRGPAMSVAAQQVYPTASRALLDPLTLWL